MIPLMLFVAASTHAVQPQLTHAGDCGWVHGRYSVANGSRIHRIWMIGTDHMLSLDIPDEGEGTPADPFRDMYGRFAPLKDNIFGDFYVCARERRIPGHMQTVHLKRMKNLRIIRR